MKLVYRILFHIWWSMSLLLAVWVALFYVTLVDEIDDETDDALEHYAEALIRRSLAGYEIPATDQASNNSYRMEPVSEAEAHGSALHTYTDEEIFIPDLNETEPARVLRIIFRNQAGEWFRLTVMTPTVEKRELREAILYGVIWLYVILHALILLVNVWVLYRMLRPLQVLLRWLDSYNVGGENAALVCRTDIPEFSRLYDAVERFSARAEQSVELQKQFIGNASHEMQTPLAVCRNRIEMMVDEGALNEEQLSQLAAVQHTLDHLVRLNRSLLLLTKIDNGQFHDPEPVAMDSLISDTAEDLAEIYSSRGTSLDMRILEPLVVDMNPSLASSLVSNLLKNAFLHSSEGATVAVRVDSCGFEISNDASDGALDASHIFDRFYHDSRREGSMGLGLSIVEAICRLYGLGVAYRFEDARHIFSIKI